MQGWWVIQETGPPQSQQGLLDSAGSTGLTHRVTAGPCDATLGEQEDGELGLRVTVSEIWLPL